MERRPTHDRAHHEGSRLAAQGGSIDERHLLLVGAGPGLGEAVARRFAEGGYRVTLLARSTDGLAGLVDGLADTGADIDTIAADASDAEGLGARLSDVYSEQGAPGVILYNAVMGAPDQLLSSTAAHLQTAYAVDVIGAIVVAQSAAPSMRAAGFGTILFTGGGFADHPVPALATDLARQGGAACRRDDSPGRPGTRRHPRGQFDDRRPDRCGNRLRPGAHRRALLGDRRVTGRLAGGVPLHRGVGEVGPPRSPVRTVGRLTTYPWLIVFTASRKGL